MEIKIIKKEFSDRVEYYNERDQLHRLDGPAIEFADGTKYWYQNDRLHREDGPAIEYTDGTKRFYLKDKRYSMQDFLIQTRGYYGTKDY